MNNYFLKIEGSTGICYESSKEPKEGFEKTETKNPQGGTVVSYRKYMKGGVFGRLEAMYDKEIKWGNKKINSICVVFVDGEDRYSVDIPLYDQKIQITSYAESFISYMPSLEKDKAYRFFPYAIENKDNLDKNGNPRKNYGISIAIARLSDRAVDKENKIEKLTYEKYDRVKDEKIPGDIPLIDWELGVDGVTLVPNKGKRSRFLYNKMKEHAIDFSGSAGGAKTFNSKEEADTPLGETTPVKEGLKVTTTASAKKSPETVKETVVAGEEDDVDLPF